MFRVYVVTLAESVWGCGKFAARNTNADRGQIPVYVGSTGLSIEDRIARHKAGGLGGNNIVANYHEGHTSMGSFATREEAEAAEQRVAYALRSRGVGVWVNKKKRRGDD
jgi:Uri superfamily endonuclease